MAKYIEREKVKEVIKNFGIGAIEDGQYTLDSVDDILLLASAIDLIPTVDAVEVVRCEECKCDDCCSIKEAMGVSGYCSEGIRKVSE